jgi:hypothetical protein
MNAGAKFLEIRCDDYRGFLVKVKVRYNIDTDMNEAVGWTARPGGPFVAAGDPVCDQVEALAIQAAVKVAHGFIDAQIQSQG